MIKSTIKGIHHTLDNHVNNINQHLFHMFQTYINTQEVNTKIQCNILKYTHNHNYTHNHIFHQVKYPNITKFNYHISYTYNNHINAYIQLSHNSNVTQCKTCDSMHVVPSTTSPISIKDQRVLIYLAYFH